MASRKTIVYVGYEDYLDSVSAPKVVTADRQEIIKWAAYDEFEIEIPQ